MNKLKILVLVEVAAVATGAFARPHVHVSHRVSHRPVVVHHHHGGGSFWGRGGRNFWPGFVGGIVGGIVAETVVAPRTTTVVTTPTVVTPAPVVVNPAPVVVTPAPVVTVAPTVVAAPVTTVQNVWVEGRYVDQVQANGSTVRVWQPGHYEQRTVTVQ